MYKYILGIIRHFKNKYTFIFIFLFSEKGINKMFLAICLRLTVNSVQYKYMKKIELNSKILPKQCVFICFFIKIFSNIPFIHI